MWHKDNHANRYMYCTPFWRYMHVLTQKTLPCVEISGHICDKNCRLSFVTKDDYANKYMYMYWVPLWHMQVPKQNILTLYWNFRSHLERKLRESQEQIIELRAKLREVSIFAVFNTCIVHGSSIINKARPGITCIMIIFCG